MMIIYSIYNDYFTFFYKLSSSSDPKVNLFNFQSLKMVILNGFLVHYSFILLLIQCVFLFVVAWFISNKIMKKLKLKSLFFSTFWLCFFVCFELMDYIQILDFNINYFVLDCHSLKSQIQRKSYIHCICILPY